MSKHTPGPWKCDDRYYACYGVIADDGVETIHNHGTRSHSDYVATPALGHACDLGSQAHANMRLIAAAPEMLEALKDVSAWLLGAPAIDPGNGFEGIHRQKLYEGIARVIAKVEGKE